MVWYHQDPVFYFQFAIFFICQAYIQLSLRLHCKRLLQETGLLLGNTKYLIAITGQCLVFMTGMVKVRHKVGLKIRVEKEYFQDPQL